MLSWMRKQTGNPWLKALVVLVAITFFGGFGFLSSTRVQSCLGVERQNLSQTLAMVDGLELKEDDFRFREQQSKREKLYMLRQQFPDYQINESMIDLDLLRIEVMKRLSREILVLKEADRMGIMVSDREVQNRIARLFSQNRQSFEIDQYRANLRNQGITEKEFEQIIRKNLRYSKVVESVRSAVTMLPEEIEERYAFDHEKVKIEYLALDPAVVAQQVLPADSVVQTYYEEHETDYYLGETRRVEYVAWTVENLIEQVPVTKKEIEEFYLEARQRYLVTPETRLIQHIMIRVARDAPSSDIEAANALIKKVHELTIAPEADFGEIAKQYSEDTTKDKNGELGWFAKSEIARQFNMQALLPELEQEAFALEIGKPSEPVQTDFGIHILKTSEKKDAEYVPLDKVSEDVEGVIRHGKAIELARSSAEKLKAAVDGGNSLGEALVTQGKQLELSEWFQESDEAIFKMDDSKVIVDSVFKLKKKKFSEPLAGMDKVYLARVVEIKPERQGTIEEVKDRIVSLLKPGVELETTQDKAKDYLEKIRSNQISIQELAKQIDIELKQTEFMPRAEIMIEEVGYSNTIYQQVARTSIERPWTKKPVTVRNKVIILHLLETMIPDMSKFDQEKEQYKNMFLEKKKAELVDAWMENLEEGKITYLDRWKEIAPDED